MGTGKAERSKSKALRVEGVYRFLKEDIKHRYDRIRVHAQFLDYMNSHLCAGAY